MKNRLVMITEKLYHDRSHWCNICKRYEPRSHFVKSHITLKQNKELRVFH